MSNRKRKSSPPSPPSPPCSSLRSSRAATAKPKKNSCSEFTLDDAAAGQLNNQPASTETSNQQDTTTEQQESKSSIRALVKKNDARFHFEYHPFITFAARDQPTVLRFLRLSGNDEGDSQVLALQQHNYLAARLLIDKTRSFGEDLKFVLHGGDWREAYGIQNTGYFHQFKRPPPPAAVQVGINKMWSFTATQLEHQRNCVACYYTSMDHTTMRPGFPCEIPVTKANKIVKESNIPTRQFMDTMARYMQTINHEFSDFVHVESNPGIVTASQVLQPSHSESESEPRVIVSKRRRRVKVADITIQPIFAESLSSQSNTHSRFTPLRFTPTMATLADEYQLPSYSPTPMKVVEMNGTRFHSCRRTPPTLSPSPSPALTVRSLSSSSASANSSPASTTTTLRHLSPLPSHSLPQIMEIDFESAADDSHSNTSTLEQDETVLEHPEWWPFAAKAEEQEEEEATELPVFSLEEPAMKRSRLVEPASFSQILPAIEDNYFTGF